MSSGMVPVAAAKATRPDPAGKDTPIGKRVCESPPVPTVSGRSMRFSLGVGVGVGVGVCVCGGVRE